MKQFNLEEYIKNPSKKVVTKDGLFEAKRLCAIKNKVNIIYDKDIEDFNFGDYTTNGICTLQKVQ